MQQNKYMMENMGGQGGSLEMGRAVSRKGLWRSPLTTAAIATAVILLFGVAPTPGASYRNVEGNAFDPRTLNALPPATALRGIRVRGILRFHALSDGPYLYQDIEAYARDDDLDRMVTVRPSKNIAWYRERYEAALVVVTGDHRRSACRGGEAVCPHLRNELDPRSIDVVGYPDKSPVESLAASEWRPLRAIGRDDALWPEINGVAERLVRATLRHDLKTIRELIDPGIGAETEGPGDRSWFDDALCLGGGCIGDYSNPRARLLATAIHGQPFGLMTSRPRPMAMRSGQWRFVPPKAVEPTSIGPIRSST